MLLQCCVRDERKFLLQNRRFQPPAHLATINYLKKKRHYGYLKVNAPVIYCACHFTHLFIQRQFEQLAE